VPREVLDSKKSLLKRVNQFGQDQLLENEKKRVKRYKKNLRAYQKKSREK